MFNDNDCQYYYQNLLDLLNLYDKHNNNYDNHYQNNNHY